MNRTHRPLTRPLLCGATSMHDRGDDGRCRDCTLPLEPDAVVCADDVLIHAQPDQVEQ